MLALGDSVPSATGAELRELLGYREGRHRCIVAPATCCRGIHAQQNCAMPTNWWTVRTDISGRPLPSRSSEALSTPGARSRGDLANCAQQGRCSATAPAFFNNADAYFWLRHERSLVWRDIPVTRITS